LEAATSSIPYLFLSASYGPVVTGWYTLTERFVVAPVNMLSMSISQVLMGELAECGRNRPETIRKVFATRLRYSAVLGLLIFLGAFFVLPPAMPILFGQRWAPVSSCLRLMAPAYALAFIVGPYGCTVEVLQRQDLHLVRAIARFAFVGSAIVAARAMRVNWEVGIGLVSLAIVMGMIVHLAISWYAVHPTAIPRESAEA
jgi:O-antigen/teichoic acid export membrane protein